MFNSKSVGLLGANGFVGNTLCTIDPEIQRFTRQNMYDLLNIEMDVLIISATSAEKWRANKDPINDMENIEKLIHFLEKLSIKHAVLISTIDVVGPNKLFYEDSTENEFSNEAYGFNRRLLEQRVQSLSSNHQILRLPGLFGPGLKKNLLFDLLNNKRVSPNSMEDSYQYLFAPRILDLIKELYVSGERILHASTEPVTVKEIVQIASESLKRDIQIDKNLSPASIKYDMRTRSRESGFIMSRSQVLIDMREWFQSEQYKIFNQ